jgi:hypothetical protein
LSNKYPVISHAVVFKKLMTNLLAEYKADKKMKNWFGIPGWTNIEH